jgi:hypothetical protein
MRLCRLYVILSLLLIALTAGIGSAGQELEITQGLKFTLPLWAILGGGSILVAVLGIIGMGQLAYGERLETRLRELYDEAGYSETTRDISLWSAATTGPFAALRRARSRIWRFTFYALATAYLSAILVLPIAAQIVTIVKLASDYAWTWLVLCPFALASAVVMCALGLLTVPGNENAWIRARRRGQMPKA